ncbi:MAG: hypothetical protein HOP09_15535 [Hyphomicrobium sp.]|nr:hypothetical protein [Hyphomicrobium sp.]
MTIADRIEQTSREAILALLSDEENARVSTAETASNLKLDAEYLDLEHLELGIQRAAAEKPVHMASVLTRDAVSGDTWGRIVETLKH